MTKIVVQELGLGLLEGAANKFLAPAQMILHPLETVQNIYNSILSIPDLPEILSAKWKEFSKLPEEQKYAAFARGIGLGIGG